MKIGSLISGGKDSMFAAYLTKKEGNELVCLGTMHAENADSYMFHVPNIRLTKLQAESMVLPLVEGKTKGVKEDELSDLEDLLREMKEQHEIEGITTGAIASQYQKSRVDAICEKLGLKSIAPLWGRDQEGIVKEMIESKFEIIIISVAAEGLDERWLGRELDDGALGDLMKLHMKYKISPVGEGGEYDTFVINCPLFDRKIEIGETEKHWDTKARWGWLEIKKACLT